MSVFDLQNIFGVILFLQKIWFLLDMLGKISYHQVVQWKIAKKKLNIL